MKVIMLSLVVIPLYLFGDYKELENGNLFYSASISGKKITWETHKTSERSGISLACNVCHKMHK